MSERSKIIVLIIVIVVVFSGVGVLAWWQSRPQPRTAQTTNTAASANTNTPIANTPMTQADKLAASPRATVETTLGTFTMKFFSTDAPELSKNFIELAKTGYYDGLTFHRIIPGFVIQGGDPNGDGTGGHSYKGEGAGLADEPTAQALKHVKGAVAWAKSSLPNSIGSQFYVVLDEVRTAQLNGAYSVFGQVVEGLDVVEKIGQVATDQSDKPTTEVKITRVTIAP